MTFSHWFKMWHMNWYVVLTYVCMFGNYQPMLEIEKLYPVQAWGWNWPISCICKHLICIFHHISAWILQIMISSIQGQLQFLPCVLEHELLIFLLRNKSARLQGDFNYGIYFHIMWIVLYCGMHSSLPIPTEGIDSLLIVSLWISSSRGRLLLTILKFERYHWANMRMWIIHF